MPAYISHLIMAKDVLEKKDFNYINKEYMITFSLGGDLSKYSKCRKQSHREKQEEFIINMCDYIKNNNLLNNKELIGTIYGHICHYVMDRKIHPLIREIDKKCIKVGIKNHTLIEAYYDNYLLKKYKLNINKLLKGKVSKVNKMIDYAYIETYNTKNVSFNYKINKLLYKLVKILYLFPIKNVLIKIIRYNRFIKLNKKYLEKETFDKLYNESVEEAFNYIKEIELYLFDK